MSPDSRLEDLHGRFREYSPHPDLADMWRRSRGHRQRHRLAAGAVGLVITSLLIVMLVGFLGAGRQGRKGALSTTSASLAPGPTLDATVPEGSMLLRVGSRIEVLTAGSKTPSILSTRIGVYDVSASGSLVATMGTQEASGTYRQSRVVLVDAFSGATVELQQAQPDQGYAGPIRWSPDAESFTYNLVTWASAPDSGLPGEPTSEDLCVYSVSSKSARCFPQVGLVLAAAWTPAGDLLIAGDPSSGLRLLNPADGSIKDLVVPGISDAAIRDAAAARLGSAPTQLQYADVAVSASGGYYSAVVLARDGGRMLGYVPVILASDGTFMSSGRDNPDLIYEAWSPTQDVLAYSRGFFGEPQSGAPPGAVRVLSPDSTDDVLLSLATVPNSPGTSDPFVLDLLWSPSGRWLAVGGRDEVWIVPSTGATPDSAIRIGTAGGAEEGSILAWIPK